jgi:hypothetical protein
VNSAAAYPSALSRLARALRLELSGKQRYDVKETRQEASPMRWTQENLGRIRTYVLVGVGIIVFVAYFLKH